jgi:transposase
MTIKKKEEFFVGIDIALEKHQYQISKNRNQILGKGVFNNCKKDVKQFVKKMENIGSKESIIIGIEATNTYHICLQKYLVSCGYKVIVINPLRTSAYKQIDDFGNKTDAIDANGICQFLIDGKHKKIKQMKNKYLKLRELCRCWQKLQCDLTRTSVRLQTRLNIINPEFTKYFSVNLCKSGIYLLEEYETPEKLGKVNVEELEEVLNKIAHNFGKKDTAKNIIDLAKNSFGVKDDIDGYLRFIHYHLESYKVLSSSVAKIKKEIRSEAKQDYCKREIDIISSMRGIGIEIAAGILSEIGDIDSFDKKSSLIRFAGMIALRKQSGNVEGNSRMSKQGSSYLRNYLHQAVMGAKLHSPAFAAVYANKCMNVKDLDPYSKRVARAKVKGNLARRILEIVWINLKKDRLFDEEIAFRSIKIDDFVRETIAVQFKQQLAVSSRL